MVCEKALDILTSQMIRRAQGRTECPALRQELAVGFLGTAEHDAVSVEVLFNGAGCSTSFAINDIFGDLDSFVGELGVREYLVEHREPVVDVVVMNIQLIRRSPGVGRCVPASAERLNEVVELTLRVFARAAEQQVLRQMRQLAVLAIEIQLAHIDQHAYRRATSLLARI